MLRWQRRTRLGLAIFGIAGAGVVYSAIGERRAPVHFPPPARLDPRAILESTGAAFQQFKAAEQEYVIEAERQLTYEDGATKFLGVRIRVEQRAGRDFVVSGREARAGDNQKDMEITGDVRLEASDGFVATTDRATFSEADATVRAAGPVSFAKGRMNGSGVGMTYDQNTDVLTLSDRVRVSVDDDAGVVQTEFSSTSAVLARAENYLELEGGVRAVRGSEVLAATHGKARLSENDDVVTFIELRGEARVEGGDAVDTMSARDIDLDYSDDGVSLERVTLLGDGAVVMRDDEGAPGQAFRGSSLDLTFASDGRLAGVTGRGDVRVRLPGDLNSATRVITSQTLNGAGEAGRGLTSAVFEDRVEYREEHTGLEPGRVARAGRLEVALSDDLVTAAVFTAGVAFESDGLRATAARLEYDPASGGLRLRGADAGRAPRVADEDIEVDADGIDVALEGPRVTATGNVRTLLHPQAGRGARAGSADGHRLPGLLREGQAANVSARSLDYQGAAGLATYTGTVMLWQGDTAIRGDRIVLDQRRADLVATGAASANLPLDDGRSVGRADEIRYDDDARRIRFSMFPPTTGGGAQTAPRRAVSAQLSGPQGDLRGGLIEVALARGASSIDRLDASAGVGVRLDTRTATGDRLTYFAQDGRYVISGLATAPVMVIETCRETTGRTVTFFRASDRIIVDGNEEMRTQSRRGDRCAETSAR